VDFHGHPFHFRDHRHQLLFVANGAATADEPFTDANFRLLSTLSKFRSPSFELLLFPSFQLDKGSGGDKDPYFVTFYAQQSGYEGLVMRHTDVNGLHRCDTLKYLLGKEMWGSTLPIRG
jgi:glutathione peroxidase-family protein